MTVEAFRFEPKDTPLHNIDPRVKLVSTLVLTITVLRLGYPGVIVMSVILLASSRIGKISLSKILRAVKPFLVLLLFIFIFKAFDTPGDVVFQFDNLTVTFQGVLTGIIVSWRLLLVTAFAAVFVQSTDSTSISDTVGYFLSPLPGSHPGYASTMTAMTVRFIPMILDESSEIRMAAKSRGIDQAGVLRKVAAYTVPLIRRNVEAADDTAVAMSSRCFGGENPPEFPPLDRRDYIAVTVAFSISAATLYLSSFHTDVIGIQNLF
ncbi:MAG: energy-coupling factor transporter transmembrane protein EcfT [Halobacteria archaeon]